MAESKGVVESHLSVLQVSGSDLKIFLGVSESSMVEMPEKYFVAIKPKGEIKAHQTSLLIAERF